MIDCLRGYLVRFFVLSNVFIFVSACTATVYGVPEKHWLLLDKKERLETINAYNAREKIKADAYLIEQKRRYEQEKKQKLRSALIDEQRKQRIDDIYQGAGFVGDLIRVTVQGGRIDFNGKHYPYQPVSFKLADGEEKHISFNATGRHRYLTRNIQVGYDDGVVLFDCKNQRQSTICGHHLAYEPSWKRGKKYTHIFLHKSSKTEAQDISISIHLVPAYSRY